MKVLELAGGPSAAFAGMLLGELGFEVLRVGHETELDAAERGFLDRRKRQVEFDPGLVRDADALIEDRGLRTLGLSARRLRRMQPDLVIASIAPFGQSGPRKDWQATELVVQAMGGLLHGTGWDGEPPLKLAGRVAAHVAGLHAAMAVAAAVYGVRVGTEPGVQIDISEQEAFLQHWSRHIGHWTYHGVGTRRDTRTFEGQGVPHTARAADGWLCLAVRNAKWDAVADLFGLQGFTSEEWREPRVRAERWSELQPRFEQVLATRRRAEWFEAAARRGLIVGPIQRLDEVLESDQFAARNAFSAVEIDGRQVACPGLPFTWED